MIERINRSKAPFYVQFEITERCNNRCYFCYNPMGHVNGNELSLVKIKQILDQLCGIGVFRINFNGGEPLVRSDFQNILEYAGTLGFDLHMNTNATLITDQIAKIIARYMKSVCTSILHSDKSKHDKMTGRVGAYDDVINGIKILRHNGIKVEVNVCTSTENFEDIYNIGKLAAGLDCYSLCSTRYILNNSNNKGLLLDSKATMKLIDLLLQVKEDFSAISDVSLPGPVPYCEIDSEYHSKLRILNIPCQYGYGLCRISPTGKVTPCTISDDIIGDLNIHSFDDIWNAPGWKKYEALCHIPVPCRSCEEFPRCKGGCVVYDESINACGETISTRKWGK
ncbi:MAG: radical SAM protein [Syntrophomonadaceae bacterium]|nr:radical SAM protein [Syntrophomonadaceae bacterium]